MLLEARDAETGEAMSPRQVRDEAVTLIAAGHETTVHAMAWTFYLLSRNPAAEAKLHAEVDAVLGERPPGMDDLPRLEHTERVLTEAMRLYPPSWANLRRARSAVRIGGTPGSRWSVRPGIPVRDPSRRALVFRPGCFPPGPVDPGVQASLPRYAYFPFGAGPRQCVGEPFGGGPVSRVSYDRLRHATLGRQAGHFHCRPCMLVPRTEVRPLSL